MGRILAVTDLRKVEQMGEVQVDDVILCDEPTGALDATTGAVVLSAIARINRELGTITAVITHNAIISGMADYVLALADGRAVSDRYSQQRLTPEELQW